MMNNQVYCPQCVSLHPIKSAHIDFVLLKLSQVKFYFPQSQQWANIYTDPSSTKMQFIILFRHRLVTFKALLCILPSKVHSLSEKTNWMPSDNLVDQSCYIVTDGTQGHICVIQRLHQGLFMQLQTHQKDPHIKLGRGHLYMLHSNSLLAASSSRIIRPRHHISISLFGPYSSPNATTFPAYSIYKTLSYLEPEQFRSQTLVERESLFALRQQLSCISETRTPSSLYFLKKLQPFPVHRERSELSPPLCPNL